MLAPAATTAVDDFLSVPADRILQTNVTSNDLKVSPLSSYAFIAVKGGAYVAPGSSTPVVLTTGLVFGSSGSVFFNPFAAGNLKAGIVVTFVYNIQPPSGARRSNNATVYLNVTAPGAHVFMGPIKGGGEEHTNFQASL